MQLFSKKGVRNQDRCWISEQGIPNQDRKLVLYDCLP